MENVKRIAVRVRRVRLGSFLNDPLALNELIVGHFR